MKMALIEGLARAGFALGPDASQPCEECSHLWGNHLAVAEGTSLDGGHVLCPIMDCNCPVTWGVTVAVCA